MGMNSVWIVYNEEETWNTQDNHVADNPPENIKPNHYQHIYSYNLEKKFYGI